MKNYFEILTNIIYESPVWVQEVIFIDMKKKLEQRYPGLTSNPNEADVYPCYVPEITVQGKLELESKSLQGELGINVYKCLNCLTNSLRVIDVTLNNFWTLEETSEALVACIKHEFIKEPDNLLVSSAILYLGNQIRLGEYVKRLNKINMTQLDNVLQKQKQYNEEHPENKKKIGEVLIDMGFVANSDIDKIIQIKDESKRRFVVPKNTGLSVSSSSVDENSVQELKQLVDKLTKENNLLKDKLRAIFNIQNKKKQ